MAQKKFFEKPTAQSRTKGAIVEKYFTAWAKILQRSVVHKKSHIAYVDLCAGQGRYDDGSASIPIRILEIAIADEFLRDHLITFFNDKENSYVRTLEIEISNIPGINQLRFAPIIMNEEIGENIIRNIEKMNLGPTLLFVDPFGYKGLSLRLINSVLKNWGSECLFFFNYNRINAGLNNTVVKEHMDALFGFKRAAALRQILAPMTSASRERKIMAEIFEALKEAGGRFVEKFTFKRDDGSRTSHHLIFVTKSDRGYKVMIDIMARASSVHDEGVASFSFDPAQEGNQSSFEFARPLNELAEMLLKDFAGQSMTMKQIYERHYVGRNFIEKNYKDALLRLESERRIAVTPPAGERRNIKGRPTFGDHVMVTFPEDK